MVKGDKEEDLLGLLADGGWVSRGDGSLLLIL